MPGFYFILIFKTQLAQVQTDCIKYGLGIPENYVVKL
jgi:hypothetical protein